MMVDDDDDDDDDDDVDVDVGLVGWLVGCLTDSNETRKSPGFLIWYLLINFPNFEWDTWRCSFNDDKSTATKQSQVGLLFKRFTV